MRHHKYNPDFKFVKQPEEFNKYTDREVLQYCLGATMYMPGTKDFSQKILDHQLPGLTSLVFALTQPQKQAISAKSEEIEE